MNSSQKRSSTRQAPGAHPSTSGMYTSMRQCGRSSTPSASRSCHAHKHIRGVTCACTPCASNQPHLLFPLKLVAAGIPLCAHPAPASARVSLERERGQVASVPGASLEY